jgi:hypothetical protein
MRKIRICRFLLLFFLIFPSLLRAQPEEPKKATALRVEERITVDGRLEEPGWEKAEEISNFIQFQPERGKSAAFRTSVKVLYDNNYLYVGFSCQDKEPEKVIARLTRRDADLWDDDSVTVFLDTFCDKRNCYYFATNILGTQSDGRIVENGLTTDKTWDGIWKSVGQRVEFGWTAEVAIDIGSLKFDPGEERTWGFNVGRSIPRLFEYSFWAGPLESPYKVSQFGELQGLSLRQAEKKYQFLPHIIAKAEEGMQTDAEVGLDARYAFSQAISSNLTLNPDFATVEADQEQVNLTRFELNLPEKRNFFLEGSEIYQQRISLSYSRRIGDIVGGFKVYGKSGGFEFSGLSAQTKKDEVQGEDSANFTVFRLKGDILKSSTVGFLVANKLAEGINRGTIGLDTSLYFTDTLKFTGQLAMSYGDYGQDNIALFLRPSYDSATFHIHLRYTHLGKYFGDNANAVGFIPDDNRHELDSAVEKTFWIKRGSLERLAYESNYNIYWGMDGSLRSWQVDQELEVDLKNKFSFGVDYTAEYKLYEKEFWNNETEFSLGYNTREWQSARLSYGFGRNFDLDFKLIEAGFNYKITPDLSLEYDLTRLIFDPDPDDETTWIHVLRATHYFNKDLFLKLFYQVNSGIDKKNIQVLFVYRFQPPFGLIQLAYQKGTARFGEKGTQGHTLFLKIALML